MHRDESGERGQRQSRVSRYTGVGRLQRKKVGGDTSRSRALALGDAVACPVKPLRRCVSLTFPLLDPSTWPGAMSSRSARPGSSVGDGRTSGGSTRQGTARALFVDDAVYLDYSAATAPRAVTSEHWMTSCALFMHPVTIRVGASAPPTSACPGSAWTFADRPGSLRAGLGCRVGLLPCLRVYVLAIPR